MRVKEYDHSENGAYFITLCTQNKKCVLSQIVGAGVPTGNHGVNPNVNSTIAKFMSSFKRFCNKEYGLNIWQPRYYDHVIRNLNDYQEHLTYINNNPSKWELDKLYVK